MNVITFIGILLAIAVILALVVLVVLFVSIVNMEQNNEDDNSFNMKGEDFL